MMTADEKNHVISNANEELDRQIVRLDTVFPFIAGEISDEARLGSLTHWAYSNKTAAKAATNDRPRREAVNHRQDLSAVLHEAEAASRSEARREAVQARKVRRGNVDADYEDTRAPRKANAAKSRGDNAAADQHAAVKRRKVERPAAIDMGTPMDRTASGAGSQRVSSKDGAEKKRSRAPNPNAAAARKKYVQPLRTDDAQLTPPKGPMRHPTPVRPYWHLLLLSELSMPHAVLLVPGPTQLGRNHRELSRMQDRPAILDNDPHPRPQTVLASRMPVRGLDSHSLP